jgi:hypothetical protein
MARPRGRFDARSDEETASRAFVREVDDAPSPPLERR